MIDAPKNANHRFWIDGDIVKSEPASEEEIAKARAGFKSAVRSCWECNQAHRYFLDEPEGHSFMCFECGRFFSSGIDVTAYRAITPPATEPKE